MLWDLDANNSSIFFSVKHNENACIRGRFNVFRGTLDFNEANWGRSNLEVEVEMASIDTGMGRRDDDLRNPDYLDVEQFPLMTFRSRHAEPHGEGFRVTGELSLHGVTQEVVLIGVFGGMVTDQRGKVRVGFSAQISVDRMEFGLRNEAKTESGGLVIGHQIDISLEADFAQRAESAT